MADDAVRAEGELIMAVTEFKPGDEVRYEGAMPEEDCEKTGTVQEVTEATDGNSFITVEFDCACVQEILASELTLVKAAKPVEPGPVITVYTYHLAWQHTAGEDPGHREHSMREAIDVPSAIESLYRSLEEDGEYDRANVRVIDCENMNIP